MGQLPWQAENGPRGRRNLRPFGPMQLLWVLLTQAGSNPSKKKRMPAVGSKQTSAGRGRSGRSSSSPAGRPPMTSECRGMAVSPRALDPLFDGPTQHHPPRSLLVMYSSAIWSPIITTTYRMVFPPSHKKCNFRFFQIK